MLSHEEVFRNDLIQLYQQIRFAFQQQRVDEELMREIISSMSEYSDKSLFLNDVKDKLQNSGVSEEVRSILFNEISWLLKKEQFRWSFDAFSLYEVNIGEIIAS